MAEELTGTKAEGRNRIESTWKTTNNVSDWGEVLRMKWRKIMPKRLDRGQGEKGIMGYGEECVLSYKFMRSH